MIWWRRGEGEGKWGERREEGRREEGRWGDVFAGRYGEACTVTCRRRSQLLNKN